jgi:DNA-binding LacI/PurR family transcriptional regulator
MEWPEAFLRLATVELAATRCTRIGLLGRPDYRATIEKEMHRAGIPYVHVADWSYETWAWMIPGAHTREICAHALTTGMIAARPTIPLPGALVSFDDTMTRGAITALHQAGLQPGRDIRIVSLGNTGSPVLDPYTGDITIIEIDPADFVAAMLERLDSLVNGGPPPEHPAAVVPRLRKPGSGQSAGLPAAVILEQIEQARTGAQR